MADISTVQANINGSIVTLTYNSATGKWEGTMTAPNKSSYSRSGGYYGVTITAEDTAGNTKSVNENDSVLGTSCRLVVKETAAPTVNIESPTASARLTNNKPNIVFTVVDNDSGVKLSEVFLKIDNGNNIAHNAPGMSKVEIEGGYRFTYVPQDALADGSHTVYVNAKDNDGNSAAQKSRSFTVDTIAPELSVASPSGDITTNQSGLNITGNTNDITSSPVTVSILKNGVDQGAVTVDGSGAFSKTIELDEGVNTLVITARDSAGKSTSVTRTVTLSTALPRILSVELAPNPVDAGQTVTISVVVEPG